MTETDIPPRHSTLAVADTPVTSTAEPRALIDYLRDRDVACPLCEYNLRGLTVPRCPECGRELALRVGLVEPRQGAWIAALIATALPAGVGMLLIVTIVKDGWPQGAEFQTLQNLGFWYYLLSIPLEGCLVWQRRRFLRIQRTMQWMIAVGLGVLGVLSIVAVAMAT